jgi:hypothetical protein
MRDDEASVGKVVWSDEAQFKLNGTVRTSLISILLLYKYSSYDYRVIFFMSKCVYIFWATLYNTH